MHDLILRGPFYFYLNILPKGGKKKQHSQHIKPKIVYTFYTEALFKMYLARSPLQERLNKACFRQSSWCCSLERERTKEVQAENLAGHVATSFRNLRICEGRSIQKLKENMHCYLRLHQVPIKQSFGSNSMLRDTVRNSDLHVPNQKVLQPSCPRPPFLPCPQKQSGTNWPQNNLPKKVTISLLPLFKDVIKVVK